MEQKRKIYKVLLEITVYALIFVFCLKIVPCYIIQRTLVDGKSMEETLKNRDNLLVEKMSYRLTEPKRFDVIVFYPYGREEKKYYIKRIIGLPGETVQIMGDSIYIDGVVLEEHYGKDAMIDAGIAKKPVKLGEDEYFVLGDNREISKDSRQIGAVSREKIDGRAFLRIYPFSEFGEVF